MGARGPAAHGCSYPGCKEPVTYDLILSMRNVVRLKDYKCQSKITVNHVYLCDKHAEEMDVFMNAYEGKEKNA